MSMLRSIIFLFLGVVTSGFAVGCSHTGQLREAAAGVDPRRARRAAELALEARATDVAH